MKAYIACEHDFSDLEEKVDYVLGNFKNYNLILLKILEKD